MMKAPEKINKTEIENDLLNLVRSYAETHHIDRMYFKARIDEFDVEILKLEVS